MNGKTLQPSALSRLVAEADAAPRLDRERELELGRRIRRGDPAAAAELAAAHLRSVLQVARGFSGYGVPLDDLVAEGNIGLVEAMRRFDPERGLRFYTYARYWIRASILAYVVAHSSVVRRGTSALESRLFFRLQSEHSRLVTELGDAPDLTARLAERFFTSEGRIESALHRLRARDLSLDAPVANDGESVTHGDRLRARELGADERLLERERRELVRRAIDALAPRLDEREQAILRDRLVADEPASLAGIGGRFGVSRERIRQIESELVAKLRAQVAALSTPRPAPLAA